MSDYEVLLRHLDREIRARKEAEEISEKKYPSYTVLPNVWKRV
ncbi:hypothetical protein PGH44_01960 [Legionella pneumophila]|nr:hypothetical protein PGH44_01960 [Legionella pneumophila]